MKVYLAARYARRHELREYTARGNSVGVENTGLWCYTDQDPAALAPADWHRIAQDNLDAIYRCQALVLFTESPEGDPPSKGGMHVEFGAALVLRKQLMVVGPALNPYQHYGAVKRFDTWVEALEYLRPKSDYCQPGFFESIAPGSMPE